MSQEYRQGQLIFAHCCLGPGGWEFVVMKNGGVAYRPRRLGGWRSMEACTECEGGHPEGMGARPLQHQALSDVVICGYVPK